MRVTEEIAYKIYIIKSRGKPKANFKNLKTPFKIFF